MNQSRFSWNVLKVVVERCSPHGTPLQHLLLSEIACWLSVGWRTKSLHGTWVLHQTSILFKAGLFKVAGMSIWVISFGEKPHQWWTLFCFQKKGKIQNAKKTSILGLVKYPLNIFWDIQRIPFFWPCLEVLVLEKTLPWKDAPKKLHVNSSLEKYFSSNSASATFHSPPIFP